MYTSKWKARAATESLPVSPPPSRPGAVGSSPPSLFNWPDSGKPALMMARMH